MSTTFSNLIFEGNYSEFVKSMKDRLDEALLDFTKDYSVFEEETSDNKQKYKEHRDKEDKMDKEEKESEDYDKKKMNMKEEAQSNVRDAGMFTKKQNFQNPKVERSRVIFLKSSGKWKATNKQGFTRIFDDEGAARSFALSRPKTSQTKLAKSTKKNVKEEVQIDEKAVSQQQQKLMGMAYALKKGDMPESEASDEVKKIAKDMSTDELKKYAGTKHEGLPKEKD